MHEGSDLGNWKLDSNGRLVSKKNSGIALDSPNSLIVLGSSDGAIYSGQHSTLSSTKQGFYLSQDGLSLSSTTGARFILNTGGGEPQLYTGKHTSLDSTANGFYLGEDGLSIGNCIEANVAKTALYVGKRSSAKKWTISGNNDNSYITYNSKGFQDGSVYIGTNGISLGSKFSVDDRGSLIAKLGLIGGWTIGDTTLAANKLILNSNGSIKATGRTYNWSIETDGTATFKKLIASNSGEIGGWKITSSSLESSSNNIKLNANGSITSDNWSISTGGIAKFNNIIIAGNGAGYKSTTGSSINFGSNFSVATDGKLTAASADVSGAIKANSGRFGQSGKNCLTIDTNGNAVIPSACISELEVSKIKDSDGTKKSEKVTWKSINSITGMKIVWSQYTDTYKLPTKIEDGKVTDYDSCSNLVGGTLSSNNKTFDISYTYKDVTTLATKGTDGTYTVS